MAAWPKVFLFGSLIVGVAASRSKSLPAGTGVKFVDIDELPMSRAKPDEEGESKCYVKSVAKACRCDKDVGTFKSYFQCSSCKDNKKWGYGCDLDCDPKCAYGCDFRGDCVVPDTCKRNSRVEIPSSKLEILNERGECQACKTGYYGLYCTEACPKNCKDKYEGKCTRGGKCYRCEDGFFGEYCEKKCPDACPKCAMKDNFIPVDDDHPLDFLPAGACLTQCKKDMYGDTCEKACPTNCDKSRIPSCVKESGFCMRCARPQGNQPMHWGPKCEKPCAEGCVDGLCGKEDGKCDWGCKPGYHAADCLQTCSDTCAEGGCDRDSAKCSYGCKAGYWGDQCEHECPEHTDEAKGCDRESGMPYGCVDGWFPKVEVTGCAPSPDNCLEEKSDQEGRTIGECTIGCEEGFHGKTCYDLCAPKCDGPCDAKTTGLYDGHCQACDMGFTGKRCTKRCHKTCESCNQRGDATSYRDCTSCHPNEPTELKDGICECIAGSSLVDGVCQCDAPADEDKEAFFEAKPAKYCRWKCKPGLTEAYGKDSTTECVTKELYKIVIAAGALNKLEKGGCEDGSYEFTVGDKKRCLRKDYVQDILS